MLDPTMPVAVLDRLDLLLQRVVPDPPSGSRDSRAASHPVGDADDAAPDPPGWDLISDLHSGWAWLRSAHALSEIELDVLLLALAPEIDVRYVHALAQLQNDVGACRPTVALVLRLIAPLPVRPAARSLFRSDSPLLAQRLITLVPDPRLVAPVLASHHVVIDEQIVDVLLQQGGLDRRLAAVGTLTVPAPGQWGQVPLPEAKRELLLGAARAAQGRRPLRLHLQGPPGSGRRTVAAALAGELGMPLLTLDLAAVTAEPDHGAVPAGAAGVVVRAVREAVLHGAVLHVVGADQVIAAVGGGAPTPVAAAMLAALAAHEGVTVLSGTGPWVPPGAVLPGVVPVDLAHPPFAARREAWHRQLTAGGADPELADELAARFHGGPGAVADAVATAVASAGGTAPVRAELFAAARGRSAHHLADLARRIEPAYGWDDLVLPADSTAQLRNLCRRVTLARTVWHDWGFERTIAHGRGATALFAGPSGTGKTMAAEVVARELGLDLFTVDLSTVISKYIGETEKNLERIFTAATEADAILMFDEADALFGKRSQVRDAHDRYANVETAYLLQRMERYEGVAVLATNLRTHLDEAFTRRLQFVVDFPFPDDEHRRRIWSVVFPAQVPLHPDLDLDALARDVRLAGGNIRNVALHAAFLAAADDGVIDRGYALAAVAHEYRKLGRVLPGVVGDVPAAADAAAAADPAADDLVRVG
ncbi:AAA family ATPase [Micromonospora sp. NPDC005299]|uniref:AAA family ATPase n=1 Tax=Micromonospora sp. NPDC005299 TaxID=3364231 RepID=UPI003683EAF2